MGIPKAIGFHTFRYLFATHLQDAGFDIRITQGLFSHNDVKTTMVYTLVLNRGDLGVQSPIDRMGFSILYQFRLQMEAFCDIMKIDRKSVRCVCSRMMR